MKRCLTLFLALLLLLSLAACGKDKTPAVTEPETESETETLPQLPADDAYYDSWCVDGVRSNVSLTLREDGTWSIYDAQFEDNSGGILLDEGFWQTDEVGLLLLSGDELVAVAQLAEDDTLELFLEDENYVGLGGYASLLRWDVCEDLSAQESYLEENLADVPVLAPDGETWVLYDGAYTYSTPDDYYLRPLSVEVEKTADDVQDGRRILEVTATFLFFSADEQALSGLNIYRGFQLDLFDAYSGKVFSIGERGMDTQTLDEWTLAWNGGTEEISCICRNNTTFDVNEDTCEQVVMTFQLELPADYDGFMLCVLPAQKSYAEATTGTDPARNKLPILEAAGDAVYDALLYRID